MDLTGGLLLVSQSAKVLKTVFVFPTYHSQNEYRMRFILTMISTSLACLTDRGRDAVGSVTRSENSAVEKITELLSIDALEVVARPLEILAQGVKRSETASKDDVAVPDHDG